MIVHGYIQVFVAVRFDQLPVYVHIAVNRKGQLIEVLYVGTDQHGFWIYAVQLTDRLKIWAA